MAVTNTRMNPPFTYDLMSSVESIHLKRVNDRLFPKKMKIWDRKSDEQKSNTIRRSKKFRKDLEYAYGWKGRTAKTAIEAMLSDYAKSFDKNGYAKVYRGLITLPSENLTEVWERYGVGESWSSYKEGADDYMGTPVADTPGAVLVLVEGRVHTEEVAPTSHIIKLRTGFPLEKEIEVNGEIEVIRYSLWRIDPEDRIKKPKWETTGKNWKPWLRRGAKPISVVEVNRKFPAYTPASESTTLPNPNRDYYAIIDGKPIYPTKSNPMAPGYQSYAWTTQDWRSIKVNNKGDIDYKEKCGAKGTQTPDGSPRLCLPVDVIRTLMKSDSGKDILRTQARKKARAKKGERVSWHPRIKEIWARVEKKTVKDKSNPPSRVILLSGPSGSGKSTFARKIAEHFDTTVIPTYTTRPQRPNERDRITVSEEEFLRMVEKGDFHEHKKLKNGFHYGRRKEDFDGVSVLEVSLAGMDYYKDKFPDALSIYLQPDITGEKLRQRLIKRGGMSGEEATKRAQIASGHIKSAKSMGFDKYYVTSTGRFDELAEEIIADIPKENPSIEALGAFFTKKVTPKSRGWQDRYMNADDKHRTLTRELDNLLGDLHKTRNWLKIPKANRMRQGGLTKGVAVRGIDEHKELPESFFAFPLHLDTKRRSDYGDREKSTVSDELDMAYDIINRHLTVVQNLVDITSNKNQRASLYKTALQHFDQLGMNPLDGMVKGVKFNIMPVWDETEIQRRIDMVSEDLDSSFGKLERMVLSDIESNPSDNWRHGEEVEGPFDAYFSEEEE